MESEKKNKSTFSSTFGFVIAAAGSAVGLGNIWRFPYLAAKDGGGLFLLVYLIFALTFGFTLLITEVGIGRKTKSSPLTVYGKLSKNWKFLGFLASLVPAVILPYYCVIGGWVIQYFIVFLFGNGGLAASDVYFTQFISANINPLITMLLFLALTTYIIIRGVNKGIESLSKILMPILFVLIIIIAGFSLSLHFTDSDGITRTGIEGLMIYLIPNFDGLTLSKFFRILVDAMGQLFFSLSVAMGIMITYGSYMKKDSNLSKSVNQIEIFDTLVAFLAGVMIIPAVYTFSGTEGLSSSGPGLLFVTMPKIFAAMGPIGGVIGLIFFAMVLFAALTSSISIMEAVVSCLMDRFNHDRLKATMIVAVMALVFGTIVCLGYNSLYFELTLPNGTVGQILDLFDYISNSVLMPLVSIGTCLLIGWKVSPNSVIEEVEQPGIKMGRKRLYIVMIKYIAPVLLFILLLSSFGII